jgi:hypothetical protein
VVKIVHVVVLMTNHVVSVQRSAVKIVHVASSTQIVHVVKVVLMISHVVASMINHVVSVQRLAVKIVQNVALVVKIVRVVVLMINHRVVNLTANQ